MLKCASFFSGVGGIDIGFNQAGFNTIYANEFDKNALITLSKNNKFNINGEDIININEKELPKFDIMLAGFPCQAFSIAGYRQGFNDKKGRGNLFFELERIFSYINPSIIFLENVKNLLTHDNGNTFKVILNILKKHNYYVKYKVLNTYLYGNLPQNRERLFIVCFKNKEFFNNFNFPHEIPLTRTFKDMLEKNVDKKYFYTNKSKIYKHLENNITDTTVYQWRRKYIRGNKKNICPTLMASMGTGGNAVPIILDKDIRKLTPRECFNFQGFPNSFEFPNIADCHLYKQAGNSVSVPVIYRIAKEIKKVIL